MATMIGTEDDDKLVGGSGDDLLQGLGGDDTLDGAGGANTLEGGAGADTYYVHSGGDLVVEAVDGGGDHVIYDGGGAYQMTDNVEWLSLVTAAAITGNDLGNLIGVLDGSTPPAFAYTADGAGGDDNIYGWVENDSLSGGDGMDTLRGSGGDDTLHGGAGDDTLYGETQPSPFGSDNDSLSGDGGDDTLLGSFANDTLSGGDGQDLLIGGQDDDDLTGGAGADRFITGQGADSVEDYVRGEDLILVGGEGVDLGHSAVTTIVQDGSDTLVTLQSGASIRLVGVSADTVTTDDIVFWQESQYDGKPLVGTDFNDLLEGGTRSDTLIGGKGSDTLTGSLGDDRLTGGKGEDLLRGGKGADRFVFASLGDGRDRILDDHAGQGDRIDLSAIDADGDVQGDQAFHFVAAFGGHAGEAVLRYDAGHDRTVLKLDADGDGHSDFALTLDGHVGAGAGWVL